MLAAGQSKRFNGIKQLADIQGQPMICHCLSHYRQGDKWINGITNGYVVLGSNAEIISQVLPNKVNKYVVSTWQKGMGHTLAQSILNVASDCSHVLIGLADQIALTQQIINGLLVKAKKHPAHIVATQYFDGHGAPVIFPKQYFSELSQLTGDNGAKSLLVQHSQQVINIPIPEAAIDIDTRQDLEKYKV
jgi:molybdenum cofactor cytidylyltransferase